MGPGMATAESAGRTVGLIGIGLVDMALAEKFLAAGSRVVGFSRSEAPRAAPARLGGMPAASPSAVLAALRRLDRDAAAV